MNVLVTGGTGFLGRHLVSYLKNKNIDPVIINSKNCDLTEKTNLLKFKDYKFDRIYHLAAWTKAGDFCLYHKGEQWLINQQINTNILWYWYEFQRTSTMIAVGTSCSYSPYSDFKENNYINGNPDNDLKTYAMTKRMLYQGLISLNDQYNMNFTHVIPSTLYGPNFDLSDSHFIFDLIKKIVSGKKLGTPVNLWGNGEQVRELIYVDDALNLIDISVNKCLNGSLNLCNGIGYSIKEYAEMICEIVDYDHNNIIYDISKFSGVSKKVLNPNKINSLTNFQFTPIKDGLKKTINYYLTAKNL